jgi:LysM repeat protein
MKYKTNKDINTYTISKRLAIYLATFIVAISIPIFSGIKTTEASLFSIISDWFTGDDVEAQISQSSTTSNLQTLPILEPATNTDPNPINMPDIEPIMYGDMLVPEIASAQSIEMAPVNTKVSVYQVRPGDNVHVIAKMFGVSVNTVLWSNNLNSKSVLRPGDTLVILPITGITHTVAKGDTLQSITKKYKADLDEVLAYNDISLSSSIVVGQKILIPNAEINYSVPTKYVAGSNPAHDTDGPNYVGYYSKPVKSGVKTQGLHGYNAVDFGAPVGTPIYASAGGTVIVSRDSGWNGGYGNFIIISHDNGTQTLYSHLSKNLVSVGQIVGQDDLIGRIGVTGKVTGPHLHFEIRGAKNPF